MWGSGLGAGVVAGVGVGVRFTIAEIAAATGGAIEGDAGEGAVEGVAIDSRGGDVAGRLFVALVAERDGHDFLDAAVAAGAGAVLVDRPPPPGLGVAAVRVADTAAALSSLGAAARRRVEGPVIGITGSVGKTTVKDLCVGALGATGVVAASERSFNNELGVPLTLANAPDDADVVVLEMGARATGNIAALSTLARPSIGVVTVVAAVHTETFGTVAGVARAKAELVEALSASGTAVLNADDPRVAAMAARTPASVLRFGRVAPAEVTAEAVTLDDELRPAFDLVTPWGRGAVRLAVRGDHQVGNALAAAAAALAAGAPLAAVASGLAAPPASPWRMALERTGIGLVILNDAYNANPTSTAAALRSLAALPAARRVAYLGTMAEIGADSADAHAATARLGAELGITVVAVAEGAYGVEQVADVDGAADHASRLGLGAGDAVLVKASRVAGLERLVDRLVARSARGEGQG